MSVIQMAEQYWERFKDRWTHAAVWVAAHPRFAMIIAIIWNVAVIFLTLLFCGRG